MSRQPGLCGHRGPARCSTPPLNPPSYPSSNVALQTFAQEPQWTALGCLFITILAHAGPLVGGPRALYMLPPYAEGLYTGVVVGCMARVFSCDDASLCTQCLLLQPSLCPLPFSVSGVPKLVMAGTMQDPKGKGKMGKAKLEEEPSSSSAASGACSSVYSGRSLAAVSKSRAPAPYPQYAAPWKPPDSSPTPIGRLTEEVLV